MTQQDIKQELHRAASELSARCDYAHALDGAGFNGFDATFGHNLAETPVEQWSPRMTHAAWRMMKKYRRQLGDYGVDYETIPEPAKPEQVEKFEAPEYVLEDRKTRAIGEDTVALSWDYHDPQFKDIKDRVKKIQGRRWDGATKTWRVQVKYADIADDLAAVIREFKFDGSKEVIDIIEAASGKTSTRIETTDECFIAYHLHNSKIFYAFRENVPGCKWDRKLGAWRIYFELANMKPLMDIITEFEFDTDDGYFDKFYEVIEQGIGNIQKSRAEEAELDLPDDVLGTPYPFQAAGIQYALEKRSVIFGDEMGLGKTPQSLLVARMVGFDQVLVVCPASVKLNWAKEAHNWIDGAKVSILTGTKLTKKKSYMANTWHGKRKVHVNDLSADIVIVNYDIVHYHVDALKKRGIKTLIADESHYIKNPKAKRSKAVYDLSREADYRMLLTGTSIKNRPVELLQQLKTLDMVDQMGGEWDYKMRYCKGRHNGYGWDFNGASNIQELNQRLRSLCYIRRKKADVMTELPPITESTVPMELPKNVRKTYDEAEDAPMSYIYELAMQDPELRKEVEAMLRRSGEEFEEEDILQEMAKRADAKVDSASRAEHLVRISVLRQLAAKGKMPSVVKWVKEFLDQDEKLVIFAVHRSVQKELMSAFPDAAHVLGEDNSTVREANIEKFQTDDDCRLIVCSLYAASEGITLTAASNVAFVELGWTPADLTQAIARVHRIGQDRENVGVWLLEASETVEEEIHGLISYKRKIVEGLLDGDEKAEGEYVSVMQELLQ